MRIGSMVTDGPVLDLTNGAGDGELTIRVSSAVGSVSGHVFDDKGAPAPGLAALIVDGPDRAISLTRAPVGPDGAYSFNGVAPGRYQLIAVPESDGDVVRGDGIQDFGDLMDAIQVHPGEKVSHDLKRSVLDER